MQATFSLERELERDFRIIEYENGNGEFHFHSQLELCIVHRGALDAVVNNNKKRIDAGTVSVAMSYDTHGYIPVQNASFTVLIVPADLCPAFFSAVQGKKNASPFLSDPQAVQAIKRHVEALKQEGVGDIEKIGYIHLILGAVMKSLRFSPSEESASPELLSKILLYIHENYHRELSLDTICRALGYNRSYISTHFKACLNIGIIRYLNLVRLRHAIQGLQDKKSSVTELALECGFSSARTFYRTFQNEFHCSPKEYLQKQ